MPTNDQLGTYIETFFKKAINGKRGNLFTRVDWLEDRLKALQTGDITQYVTTVIQENTEIIQPSIKGGVVDPTDATFSGIVISPSGQLIDGILYSFAIVVDGVVVSGFGDDGGTPVIVGTGGDMTKAVYDPTPHNLPSYVVAQDTEPTYHYNGLLWWDTGIVDPGGTVVLPPAETTGADIPVDVAPATITYYVDSVSGNNASDGLSTSTAWETIAKVNATSLIAGAYVLFKCGSTWSGTELTIPSSGTAAHYIYFGKYGTGANPIINNSGAYAIDTNGKNYICIDNVDSADGTQNIHIADSHHIWVVNGDYEATTTDESSINITSSTDGASHDILLENLTIHDTPGWGVTAGTNTVDALTIRGCSITDIGTSGAVQHHGLYLSNVTNLVVETTYIDAPWNGCIKLVESGGKTLSGVISRVKCTNAGRSTVAGHDISLDGITGGLVIKGCHLADNLLGMGIYSLAVSHDVELYNNTIVRHYFGIHMETGTTGWIVKNNIVVQDMAWIADSSRCCLQLNGGDSDIGNNTFDNNLWYFKSGGGSNNPIRSNTTTLSFATWNGKTGTPDAGTGLNVDPEFVTAYTDLHLQATSDAIGAGADVTGVTLDYDGVTLGSPPDMGAYSYVP